MLEVSLGEKRKDLLPALCANPGLKTYPFRSNEAHLSRMQWTTCWRVAMVLL